MNAETLGAQLAALPGASVRAADHASVGYDLDVALPESSLLAAVGIMDGAGYFLEGMTGVDWLGECEALRKEAEAKAKKAAEAAAASAEDAPSTSEAAPPETPVQESIPQEDELEVVYDFNLYSARHRVCLRVRTPRSNPQIHTIAEIYPIAHWHEREIHEFFGIVFIGHPYLIPLLLPEDAEYHPLLKDYSA
ncbi:NADH-quinone oxidoreductase subunit C [Desulfovibrio desulfuricans]|uniref:NAD(P)H-quinone oxidoreductase subunit J, chloroplastic n=1 Tax=bioreactor metagenome TaxID=1076179 RepID=A0A644UTV7_9ZZZZ|nr:NADH-quinone oxidoreductase subunit C [Desulfovibrio desulfuricans]MBT9748911.1 NADH-quinone oxidoreductase subunit C [Desulfovibrio desulfuricans]MEA4991148.1 NADH-quinone oxidoreductase subunit C [Desulfovibrio desulfuricans]